MRILDRYLLREYLGPFGVSLTAFSLLFVIFDLFDRMGRFLNASAPTLSIPVYYFHHLFAFSANISLIVAILPISLLLASLYCASNLVRHNEFVAMMAGGVSLRRVLLPFAAVGLAVSLLALAAQEWQAARSNAWMRRYEREVLKRDPLPDVVEGFVFMNKAENRIWRIPFFKLTDFRSVGALIVTQMDPDGGETVYTTGSAFWADGTWWLRNPLIEKRNRDGALMGEPRLLAKQTLEMRNWKETPRDFAVEHRIVSVQAEGRNMSPWQDLSAADIRTYLAAHPDFPKDKKAEIATDYHARYSTPFICLLVSVLGLPAGLRTGRTNAMTRILLSLALFFLFYLGLQFSLALGKMRWIPPLLAAWLPNLLFAGLGVRMIFKPT